MVNIPDIEGYEVRAGTLADTALLVPLIETELNELIGVSNVTEQDFHDDWTTPRFSPENSTLVVTTHDGKPVALAEIWDTSDVPVLPVLWFYIHPDHRDSNVGDGIMQWVNERTRQTIDRAPENARVTLQCYCHQKAQYQADILQRYGMTTERSSYEMLIDFDTAPPEPQFPDNISIVTYKDHPNVRDFAIAHKESFRDHRGFVDTPLDYRISYWQHFIDNNKRFDPEFWFLAKNGDDIAGVLMAIPQDEEDPERGHISVLGVLRPYRKQGLGLALLHYAFGEFWRHGIKKAGLGVDGSSITGATRLYERAGMHIGHVYHAYEKFLRDGDELTVQ